MTRQTQDSTPRPPHPTVDDAGFELLWTNTLRDNPALAYSDSYDRAFDAWSLRDLVVDFTDLARHGYYAEAGIRLGWIAAMADQVSDWAEGMQEYVRDSLAAQTAELKGATPHPRDGLRTVSPAEVLNAATEGDG